MEVQPSRKDPHYLRKRWRWYLFPPTLKVFINVPLKVILIGNKEPIYVRSLELINQFFTPKTVISFYISCTMFMLCYVSMGELRYLISISFWPQQGTRPAHLAKPKTLPFIDPNHTTKQTTNPLIAQTLSGSLTVYFVISCIYLGPKHSTLLKLKY